MPAVVLGGRRRRGVASPLALPVLALVLVLVGGSTAAAQDADDLVRARDRIADIQSELEEATAASDDADADLQRAREALARIEDVVNAVAQRVATQEGAVRVARADLDRVAEEVDATRRGVRLKAVELYKRGGGGDFTAMIDAADIQSAMDRSAFLRLVDKGDTAELEDLDSVQRRRTAAAEVLEHESELLDELLADREAVMAEAERARDSSALAAAAAEEDVADLESEHDHLTDLASEIETAIAEREAAERAAREAAAAEAASRAGAADAAASEDRVAADDGSDDGSRSDDTSGSDDGSGDHAGAPPPASGGGYAWPLCGIVTSEFTWRWGRQHEGLDIDDNRTDRITAAQSGTVISAGYNSGGYGNLVLVQHADGVVTAYAHQRSIAVSVGQTVSRGQLIGRVGSTGNSTGPHLHFETRVDGSRAVDPRNFLSGSGC